MIRPIAWTDEGIVLLDQKPLPKRSGTSPAGPTGCRRCDPGSHHPGGSRHRRRRRHGIALAMKDGPGKTRKGKGPSSARSAGRSRQAGPRR
jgi:hypothetical protein